MSLIVCRFEEMKKQNEEPDATSYNYMIQCLCQASKIKKAWKMMKKLEKKEFQKQYSFVCINTHLIVR